MVSKENCGQPVKYWKNGTRMGTLVKIEGNTAYIHHPVLKREQKVPVMECEPIVEIKKMTIYEQLFKAAQTQGFEKQTQTTSDEAHIKALLTAVYKAAPEVWDAIPIPAREWFNNAVIALNEGRKIPPCPGFVGINEVQKISDTKEPQKGLTASEVLNANPPTRQDVAAHVQATTQVAPAAKPKRKITGVMDGLRKVVILHPDWSTRQVYDYLKLNGYPDVKIDTISVDGGNIRRVIDLAKQFGFWKEPDATAPQPQDKEEKAEEPAVSN